MTDLPTQPKLSNLRFLLCKDTDMWIAICLEHDLLTQAPTQEQCMERMYRMFVEEKAWVEYDKANGKYIDTYGRGKNGLPLPAPYEYHYMYDRSEQPINLCEELFENCSFRIAKESDCESFLPKWVPAPK